MNIFKFVLWLAGPIFYPAVIGAQIILSEIMFNPLGNERYNEFIELYNLSAIESIDLNAWLVSDGSKYNIIKPHSDSTVLRPRQYAVILVQNYFDNSSEYDNRIPDSAIIMTINTAQFGSYGLANEKPETVSIFTPDTVLVASRSYHVPNPDGISEEKIIPENGDEQPNWGHSLIAGGTPGDKNSITPEEFDVALDKEFFQRTPANPGYGEAVFISIEVKNTGLVYLNNVSVVCCYQTAGSDLCEVIGDTVKIASIEAFASQQVNITWADVPPGVHLVTLAVHHPLDRIPDNNNITCEVIAGYPERALIINEIMYNPAPEMPEWIELFNPGPEPVNLKNWQISDADSLNAVILCDSSVFIKTFDFMIITRDSTIYDRMNPGVMVFMNKNLPSLNNDEDGVTLFDGAHDINEQIFYDFSWGGAKSKSLERINPDIAGNNKNNWSTSVDAAGHTAGYRNSIYTPVIPENTSLTVFPDPFSPDGDGHDDLTAITYTLHARTAFINIRIFDIQGHQVRFLKNNTPAGSNGTMFWDGLDDEGITCRMGIYIILIEVEDQLHEKIDRVQKTVVLAKSL